MEEIAYMVCMRVDELDDPVENSTTTACVECGDDIWISHESRKQLSKVKAMPLCSTCALRIAQENETTVRTLEGPSIGQFQEIMGAMEDRRLGYDDLDPESKACIDAMPDDIDAFDALKATARMAGNAMRTPGDDWGSMAVMISWDGSTYPPIPMQQMLDSGLPKEIIAKQIIPAYATASQAKRVLFGISTWTLAGEGVKELEGEIRDHPDHKEALVLIDITADGVQQMSTAEIIRDMDKPRLGEWIDTDKPDTSAGLFVDTLIPVLQLIRTLQELP